MIHIVASPDECFLLLFRRNMGNLAMLLAMRRASSRVGRSGIADRRGDNSHQEAPPIPDEPDRQESSVEWTTEPWQL